jgi:peptidoglycan/xylan/chitin deacetylase (PgdA/CDA1 family)
MKKMLKAALFAMYKYSGIPQVQELLSRWRYGSFMSILLFHRVTDEVPEDGITVGTQRFRKICAMLRRQFNVVPLAEVFRLARAGEKFPPRTVAITFDDSYRDNLAAARVLAEFGLPACFFVPTGYVETELQYPWDRDLKKLENLRWHELREIVRLGHEIGGHTVTHPNMAEVSDEQARFELVEAKRVLEEKLGQRVRWFAYPFGDRQHCRPDQSALVRACGYEGCVSAYSGFIFPGQSAALLPREAVPFFKNVTHLELYLRGVLHWFYNMKRRVHAAT